MSYTTGSRTSMHVIMSVKLKDRIIEFAEDMQREYGQHVSQSEAACMLLYEALKHHDERMERSRRLAGLSSLRRGSARAANSP